MPKTAQFAAPDDWTPAERALFVILTDWIAAALGRAWRERNIEPEPEVAAEIDALMVDHAAFFVEAMRKRTPGPREPRELVEQFVRHVLVHHFGSPADRRREMRLVN